MLRSVRLLRLGIVLAAACSAGMDVPAAQDGDIIFQTSLSSQSVAIQRSPRLNVRNDPFLEVTPRRR
jgi:hypothetical protein